MTLFPPKLSLAAARLAAVLAVTLVSTVTTVPLTTAFADDGKPLRDPREVHLADLTQLTYGEGENAEAYWSPDGSELIYQSTREHECDQIFRVRLERPEEKILVSTGEGRTTCAYFTYPEASRVLYASTHLADPNCPPRPDFSQGYVWPIYPTYELYSALPDGTELERLTDNQVYDAEATVCPVDGRILFTSTRDGDLDLYVMNADGSDVKRLTEAPGYDGGAFFSADCERIVWRASRPREGEELEEYQRLLLEQGLVRPSKLEIWVADADGGEARQITYLDAGSFAPFFHPSGRKILFSTNYQPPGSGGSPREFDIWSVGVDGSGLERVTYAPGFDGFPMFSPDGSRLAFASNRRQKEPGQTDVYVARWIDAPRPEPPPDPSSAAADRFRSAVDWLADDRREGRGIGTEGLEQAAAWIEAQFQVLGLEGAGNSYRQSFDVTVAVKPGPGTVLELDGTPVDAASWSVAAFSARGEAAGEVVPAGYGITAEEHGIDDYAGRDVAGKIALVRRFVPAGEPFDDEDVERRYSDLRYKAWNAREHGAAGLIIVDLPVVEEGAELPGEAPLPRLEADAEGDAGLPVAVVARDVVAREAGRDLFAGGHRARLAVDLLIEQRPARNVIARLPGNGSQEGAIVIGAHYDHLGYGGRGSLAPDSDEPHNGADDNASGTAALLEIARELAGRADELGRDVIFVAFSGEESGLLGSTRFTREPPPGVEISELYAMLNLDMVGRLRGNRLSVLGGDSAEEWGEIVTPACERLRIGCVLGGDGYGPSDQTPFYAAGVPVLHFFSGTHFDYHKPSDDAERINAAGGARIAALVADVAVELANREAPLTYKTVPAPPPAGDARSHGASLGTIPDYAGDGRPGVLLAGAREDSPAARAGFTRGDLLVRLAGREIGDIYDFMFVLRQSKPGETVKAVVVRGGEEVELEVTFGENRRMR